MAIVSYPAMVSQSPIVIVLVGESRAELGDADGVGKLPRDQRLPAGRAERRVAVGPLEQNSLASQSVEVGSGPARIALDPKSPAGMVVGDDQEQVGSLRASVAGPERRDHQDQECRDSG